MNKIGSIRTINIKNLTKSGLKNLKEEKIYKKCDFKIVLTDENFKILKEWDDELMKTKEGDRYRLVKDNSPYPDYCYSKIRLEFSKELKTSIDKVLTKVTLNNKEMKDLTLEKLQFTFENATSCNVTLKATSLFEYKGKKGIRYIIDKLDIKD